MSEIDGGYTIWARKVGDSEIFMDKPATWFKIWFYIVSHVVWKSEGKNIRGNGYFNYSNLKDTVFKEISPDVYKKCIHFLKMSTMISTTKSTRGMYITVLNYDYYQNPSNYEAPQEAPVKAQQKHRRSTTIYKERKKEKNTTNEQSKNYLIKWNQVFSTAYVSTKAIEGNLAYWLDSYKLEEILEAISGIKKDKFWKDKDLPPEWLLRQKENGEPVDRIGRMKENLKEDFSLGINFNSLNKK